MEPSDMNLDDMINNPFKNIDLKRQRKRVDKSQETFAARAKEMMPVTPQVSNIAPSDSSRMEKNHASQDRLLAIEKNALLSDKRVDTIKRIIEQQNQRIDKLEEELDILRRHLDPNYVPVEEKVEEVEEAEEVVAAEDEDENTRLAVAEEDSDDEDDGDSIETFNLDDLD